MFRNDCFKPYHQCTIINYYYSEQHPHPTKALSSSFLPGPEHAAGCFPLQLLLIVLYMYIL